MGNRGAGGDGSSLKRALLVTGGLALAWLTVETAFKPFLDRLRASISRSDPARDPDEDDNDVEVESEKGEAAAEEKDGKADRFALRATACNVFVVMLVRVFASSSPLI
ncbi:hypothetical protein ZIOFF_068937 [Zingiber officinale]|uniref:Outer envelope membrane protein 7 n=1 Tax=Zingiber officinale TaxID=94328 RepID=A0A8J5C3E9_ZINOF|nr:hypothetical protein ZIOFF_068937 [Zingiber officinale]